MKHDRRKSISTPQVFNEKRAAMGLIESASPTDIYLWCFCIVVMFTFLFSSIIIAFAY
ncbi:MAG: hypothetical protein CFH44_00041 [Proteobacteria bacterium]|jgi:hypothetical protein|nr:MAG: hypothetical protein CFH44_00041 [Pseudomonadota bacterium]|tara:strand:- start:211 stop:384 length:174 start_codon:yes stop_codon:yes gene_type:complete